MCLIRLSFCSWPVHLLFILAHSWHYLLPVLQIYTCPTWAWQNFPLLDDTSGKQHVRNVFSSLIIFGLHLKTSPNSSGSIWQLCVPDWTQSAGWGYATMIERRNITTLLWNMSPLNMKLWIALAFFSWLILLWNYLQTPSSMISFLCFISPVSQAVSNYSSCNIVLLIFKLLLIIWLFDPADV